VFIFHIPLFSPFSQTTFDALASKPYVLASMKSEITLLVCEPIGNTNHVMIVDDIVLFLYCIKAAVAYELIVLEPR